LVSTGPNKGNVSPLPHVRHGARMSLLVAVFDSEFGAAVEGACAPHEIEIVATAENAPQAVQRASRLKPDVCLIENGLPGGALRAVAEMRSRLPLTKIVLIGDEGDCSDEDLFAAIRTGVEGFLFKQMNLDRLPLALLDVREGHAALPRNRTARVMSALRSTGPSWRTISADGPRGRLTTREWEVLELLGDKLSTNEIAGRLVLSDSAVRCHISSAVRKLGVSSRTEAVELLRAGAA
jgi:DNA-binding NarL/FixJ family response regulator